MPVGGGGAGINASGRVFWQENAFQTNPDCPRNRSGIVRQQAPNDYGSFSPSSVSGLQVWHDSDSLSALDGSALSTLTDRLAAFNATLGSGTGPKLRLATHNGRNLLELTVGDGTQLNMSSSLMSGATAGTAFIVFRLKNDPTTNGGNGGDAGGIIDAFTSNNSTNMATHTPYTDGVFYDHFGVTVRQTTGNPTPDFSTYLRLYNSEVTSAGTWTQRIDGTQTFQAAGQTVGFGTKTRHIGYSIDQSGNLFYVGGFVAEILIFNRVLTQAERESVEGYLAWKWALVQNLPGTHPYISSPPQAAGGTVISASGLTVGSPALDTPALTQTHVVAASNLTVGALGLATPTLTQNHVLTASNLTVGVLGLATPTASILVTVTASNLTVSSPTLATPSLTQKHVLAATNLTVGSPSLASPTITQNHVLTASGLTVSSLVLASPALTQLHNLSTVSLTVGSPSLANPTLTQRHLFTASNLTVGSPALDTPQLFGSGTIIVAGLTVGSPSLATPALTQKHTISASGLAVGSPTLSAAVLTQRHQFAANDNTVSPPVFGLPVLAQVHHLTAIDLSTGSPSLALPTVIGGGAINETVSSAVY